MDYQRMSIYKLRDRARASHPEHTPEAPRAFVMRALDMEVERRTVHPSHLGYYTQSPMAPGSAAGGTDIAREPLAHIADNWSGAHDAHEYVASWLRLARIPERQLLAALIQARRLHANLDQTGGGKDWARSYDQIAANLGPYARALGWGPGAEAFGRWYLNGKAIKNAGMQARVKLILLAQL